jgi:hypothetical protein
MDDTTYDDIDFDAVGSLLLDDENLASIFELALTDTNFDEDDGEDDEQTTEKLVTPSSNFIDGAQLEQQLLQQSQQQASQPQQPMMQGQQQAPPSPQQPGQQGGAIPNFNWAAPYPTWRWGMPLPRGYPPPPVALQQHMMRLQHMQHMQHMQRMQQMQHLQQQQQQPQPQQQGSTASEGMGPQQSQQKKSKKKQNKPKQTKVQKQQDGTTSSTPPSNNKGSAKWADAKTPDDGDSEAGSKKEKVTPLSLEEIMKAEKEASASGKSITRILQSQPAQQRQRQQQQPQQQQQRQQQRREPKEDSRRALGSFWHGNGPLPRVDETCMMKVHELVGIMKFQMRPLYTNDTFRDDYYFAEANVRQQTRSLNGMPVLPLGSYEGGNEMGGAASRLGARPGINQPKRIKRKKKKMPGTNGKISVPVKLSLSGRENVSRQRLMEKARKFQQESKALGLHVKGSVRTPRKLMDIGIRRTTTSTTTTTTTGDKGEMKSEQKQMLSSSRWQVRLSINRCVGLLMSIKTLVDSGSRGKGSVMEKAGLIQSLATELGITSVVNKSDNEDDVDDSAPEAACDPQVLQSIANTTKGRRMLCRALPLLNPVQMRALVIAAMRVLPSLVAVGDPKDIESATSLQLKKEAWWKALLDEKISDLLSRGFGTAMMPFPSDGQPVFEVMPVALGALLDAHDDQALQKLVKTRGGATAIQDFLARGQTFCAPHPDFSAKWNELYQSFISKATATDKKK